MSERRLPHVLTRPGQGWSSLLLLLGMLVLLGVSLADSRPLELFDHGSLTASLPVVMVAAGLIGYLLARSTLGVVRAHFVGALVAAFVLLLITGAALLEQSPLPTELGGISERVAAVWAQLDSDIGQLIDEEITTSTVTVYLVLGALSWTTAQFGAFSVFRYDRGGPAVMAVGTILFLNVGLGSQQEQDALLPVVPVLALFAALALLLLMRLQLVQQRFAWARRHISDAGDVGRLFIRTGVAFVLIAVVSASSLTVWATVEAQEIDMAGLEEPLGDFVDQLSEVLDFMGVPTGDAAPAPLGSETALSTTWNPGDGVAFTAEVTDGELYDNYWWGKADDRYDYQAQKWRTTTEQSRPTVSAEGSLIPATDAWAGGDLQVGVTITIGDAPGYRNSARVNLYRPPDIDAVENRGVRARRTAGGGYSDLEYLEPLEEGDTVAFEAFVRDYRPGNEDLTGNRLRATADVPYPEWVLASYLRGRNDRNIVGSHMEARIKKVRAQADGDTPYDLAVAVQAELRTMDYEANLGDLCDEYDGVFTECLLAEEKGFCQQYATTMVMMMRAMDVPARFVTGYLRGTRDESGRWVVEQQALHNWVEVYFPGPGWVRFDPTPGLRDLGQVPTELQEGEDLDPGPLPTEEPDLSTPPAELETPLPTFEPPVAGSDGPESGSGWGDTGIFISLAGLVGVLVAVMSVMLLYRLRRLPKGDDSLAYRGIVSLATRLGYGPHPSQTEYEYAGSLSEAIPSVREDLYIVTDAQVQTTYGERELDEKRRGPLRSAYARIRTALLRLSIRWRR